MIGQEGPMQAAKGQKQSQFYDCCCDASESQQRPPGSGIPRDATVAFSSLIVRVAKSSLTRLKGHSTGGKSYLILET